MATASRSDKGGGRTNWQTGDTITETILENDFANVYTQVNGNLDASNLANGAVTNAKVGAGAVDNSKVAAGAAITVDKLAQTAGQLDADIVDDFWASTAESKTATDPGTQDSPSAATNLEEELARLRYVIKRLSIGAGTLRTTGADSAGWYDGVAVGPNLIPNGSLLDGAVTPFGFGVDGAPATQVLATLPVGEGVGNGLRLADGAGATTDGIDKTITGLKAGTLYLLEARVLPTTANVILGTTNAAVGTFDDLAIPSSGAAWQTLSGLFWTDGTPTAPEISLRPSAAAYDFTVAWISLREVLSPASTATNEHEGTNARGGNLVRTATSVQDDTFAAATGTVETDTTVTVVVPGPGYVIRASASAGFFCDSNETITLLIEENVNGGGWNTVATRTISTNDGDVLGASIEFLRGADATNTVTPGSTYQYRVSGTASGGLSEWNSDAATEFHRMTVQLLRMGE